MSDLEKKIITTQGVVRNKRTKLNGEGSIYFNKVREVWTGAFYDIHGKRRVASFKDRDDTVNWIGKQGKFDCPKCRFRSNVSQAVSVAGYHHAYIYLPARQICKNANGSDCLIRL